MKTVALGVMLLLGGCAPFSDLSGLFGGGDVTDFAAVDLDKDASVTPKELTKWGQEQGIFDMLGGVENYVDPLDLASGLFGLWNIEGSGLTKAEFDEGITRWFPDADAGDYSAWDLDGNGTLDAEEMRAGFAHTGIADTWDRDKDGQLSRDEVYKAMYKVFDENGDDRVSQDEWDAGIGGWGWNL